MTGTRRTTRLKPLRAALRLAVSTVTLSVAGLVAPHAAPADGPAWDCRMTPDGRDWTCTGGPPAGPAAPADGLEATPAPEAAPGPAPAPPVAPAPEVPTMPAPAAPAGTPPEAMPHTAPLPDTASLNEAPAEAPAPDAPTRPLPADAAPAPMAPPETAAPVPEPAVAPTVAPGTQPAATATSPAPSAASRAFRADEMPDLVQPAADEVAPVAAGPEPAPQATEAPAPSVPATPAQPFAGGLDAGIDWGMCRVTAAPGRSAAHDSTLPVEVSADAAVAELGPQQVVFSGNVQLVQGGLELQADRLTLNRATGEIEARGGLLLTQPDIRVAGSAASYQLASGRGQVEQASYRVPSVRARGEAEHAELLGDGRSTFRDISYTTCAPGDADWLLSAEALELDRNEGVGTAHQASLRFMGVPLLYAPVFTFPIDDRRRSGLLVPTVGQSGNTGFDLSVPYYLNLAPNYDLTVVPRLMSKRGLMLGGEFRFLTEATRGTLAAEFLPDDRDSVDGRDARGSASLRAQASLHPQASAGVNLNYVSDNDYLRDFGSGLAVTSTTHLERTGEIRFAGKSWNALARLQAYQTLDDSIVSADRPYGRLPQLLASLRQPDGIAGLTYHLDAEYVNFYRRDSVRGHRVDLFPALSLPLRETWGFFEPKVGARYTGYRLTDQAAGLDDAPSNLGGVFSLDSGLYFDRGVDYLATDATQTLEPRLYYLLVPRSDQDDQPVFDTGLLDFNFDNLFRENRFNGPDRLGDANQLTLALTSRVIADASGVELVRASLGQILYFADREVTLPGVTAAEDDTSALVGELAARLGRGWRTRLGLEWDPNNGNIDQSLAQLGYRDRGRHVFNAAYRLRDGVTEQTDLAAFWPINEQFTLIGRHNYSLQDDRLLEALAGIEYGRCCWRLRALVRQYADGTGDDQNLAFLLQLELNGLGRLGDDIESTLERGIYGYGTNDYE